MELKKVEKELEDKEDQLEMSKAVNYLKLVIKLMTFFLFINISTNNFVIYVICMLIFSFFVKRFSFLSTPRIFQVLEGKQKELRFIAKEYEETEKENARLRKSMGKYQEDLAASL